MRQETDAQPTGAATTHVAEASNPAKGLSHFLGKVLDQLSLSSWLPAAMLVGNGAILIQLHAQLEKHQPLSLAQAIVDLTRQPWGTLIVVVFALVVTTVITQAFEYEMIRVLEGYLDATRGPIQWIARGRIRRHARKRRRLATRRDEFEQAAFMRARALMLTVLNPPDRRALDVLEDEIFNRTPRFSANDPIVKAAADIPWQEFLTPSDMYRLQALDERVGAYPDANRVLPSRLGNILRSAEDGLDLGEDESIEGYVIRYHDELPPTLREEHREYRVRLDMYCCLVLVFLTLAVMAGALLQQDRRPAIGAFVAYVLLAWVAYEAAITSARGFGHILAEINLFMSRKRLAEAAPKQGWLRRLLRW